MGKVVNVECALRDIFHVSHRSSQNLKGILLLLYLSKSERPCVRKLLIQFECNAGICRQAPQAAVGGSESKGFFILSSSRFAAPMIDGELGVLCPILPVDLSLSLEKRRRKRKNAKMSKKGSKKVSKLTRELCRYCSSELCLLQSSLSSSALRPHT